jgi:hypothetical protein
MFKFTVVDLLFLILLTLSGCNLAGPTLEGRLGAFMFFVGLWLVVVICIGVTNALPKWRKRGERH